MKIINFWTGTALAIIAFVTMHLVLAIGEPEPAGAAAFLLVCILVLGFGAGAHASRREVERLTLMESARRIQAGGHAAERDRMEAEIERLQRQLVLSAVQAVLAEKIRAARRATAAAPHQQERGKVQ